MEHYKIPKRFFDDHQERDLPTPRVHHETKAHYWINAGDPALPELINDAAFYADTNGPDEAPRGVVQGAKALLKALHKVCSICGMPITNFGNNAWPINAGRCCDTCNAVEVLPERLKLVGVSVTNG